MNTSGGHCNNSVLQLQSLSSKDFKFLAKID